MYSFFFFNDTATTEIYTLSLHDALPISSWILLTGRPTVGSTSYEHWLALAKRPRPRPDASSSTPPDCWDARPGERSEEHTSELQSRLHLVCRLLLEKKKTRDKRIRVYTN